MPKGCFISYKTEDKKEAKEISLFLKNRGFNITCLESWIENDNSEAVLEIIRKKYMSNSSVTLFLIGNDSYEDLSNNKEKLNSQYFIIRELQATLYNRKGNPRDGLIGIVLPKAESKVFPKGTGISQKGKIKGEIKIDDETVVREFSRNFWMSDKPNYGIKDDKRFAVLCRLVEFKMNPELYIERAIKKAKNTNLNVQFTGIYHNYILPLK